MDRIPGDALTNPTPPTMRPDSRGRRGMSAHTEAARTVIACEKCRQKKVKCDGQWPCKYCMKRNLTCLFNTTEKRKMFPVSEIQDLRAKVARYEGADRSRPRAEQTPPSETQDVMELSALNDNDTIEVALSGDDGDMSHNEHFDPSKPSVSSAKCPNLCADPSIERDTQIDLVHAGQQPPTVATTAAAAQGSLLQLGVAVSSMAPETLLSSTDAFGSEVRTLVSSRPRPGSCKTATPATTTSTLARDFEMLENIPQWPTEDEANTLLELVVLQVGLSQQLFDVRTFSDSLSRLYHDANPAPSLASIWITEVLLVMAIGRLLAAEADGTSGIPGEDLYNAALSRLPQPGDAKKYGIVGIEVVALTALFLQIADRKEEAYIYASLALRLAIAQNLHSKRHNLQRLNRSESVHRNRLWWSVYMQERRLAAAGGHPMGIDDKAITIDPPGDAWGFPSASAIAVNVRAARITGQITGTIYSNHGGAETSFIEDVQNILNSLHEIRSTMPAEYQMSMRGSQLTIAGRLFGETSPQTARTSSSLYLSIYQAVIHAVRPILLYMARNSGEGESAGYNEVSPTLRRLAEICVESASKSLAILNELRNWEIFPKNAFLDLDAVFSVGFIFVLVEAINRGKNLGKSGIEGSRSILKYLVGLGNRAAAKRLAEMDQMCAHLETLPPDQSQEPFADASADLLLDNFSFELGYVNNMDIAAQQTKEVSAPRMSGNPTADSGETTGMSPPMDMWPRNADLADITLEGENGLYWVFQPGFYTGEELADWETLENCLAHQAL
ncbi:hypothetical protein F5X68DRAFT_241104 [Plectosphaerella plurivora]|uniref:Zn(2)-C6 fungal-type domain-containing protein n=1 Tax=Plectosphaerella plurivora TaxID=936078 RepID=A0A9P9AA22_9PEZI|nr:hypothetical protein F5X68DRAFT_241104 [Plectosphaerella plurivora]